MTTKARFCSICPFCAAPIQTGDPIVLFEEKWGHEDCPEDWDPDEDEKWLYARGPIDAEEMREWGLKA